MQDSGMGDRMIQSKYSPQLSAGEWTGDTPPPLRRGRDEIG